MPDSAEPISNLDSVVALRCVIGRTTVAVPRQAIDSVVELALGLAPPHASRLVSGLALHEGELVIVLGIAGTRPESRPGALASVSAILFAGTRAGARWAIEVASIGSFTQVTRKPETKTGPTTTRREPWLERGIADDGKEVRLLDFVGLLAEVMGPAPASQAVAATVSSNGGGA